MTTAKDVYEMDEKEFTALLESVTTAQHLWENAKDIYDVLGQVTGQDCMDSVLREWAFTWVSDKLDKDYEEVYDRWLGI